MSSTYGIRFSQGKPSNSNYNRKIRLKITLYSVNLEYSFLNINRFLAFSQNAQLY